MVAGQDLFCHHDLKEIFLSRITQNITDYLTNAKFSYVDIDSNLNDIAVEVRAKTENVFTDLGFDVLDLFRLKFWQQKLPVSIIPNTSNCKPCVMLPIMWLVVQASLWE